MIENVYKKQSVPKLCETRWTARVDTLSTLISKYQCAKQSESDVSRKSSDSDAKLKAGSHLRESSDSDARLKVGSHLRESSDSDARLMAGSHLRQSSDSDARLEAGSHLMIQISQIIVALVVTQHILSYTRPLAQALVKSDCDIVKACIDANTCKKVIREQRDDNTFRNLWGGGGGGGELKR